MSYPSVYRSRTSVRAALGLILLVAGLPACRGEAQSNASGAAAKPGTQIPDHRLSESVIRKVSAVLREWDPTPSMEEILLAKTGNDVGMSKEKFEALPDSQQQWLMVESMKRGQAKQQRLIEGQKQLYSLQQGSLSDRVKVAEGIPALKAALGKAGFSTREFVQAYNAYHQSMAHVLLEESGPQPPPPPGIQQDNLKLWRTMSKAEPLWTSLGLTEPGK